MKKLYASLAALAAAALVTASAAIPEIINYEGQTRPLGLNPKISVPSEKALNTFASLATVDNNGIKRVKSNATAADVEGSYVNLTTSLFNNNVEAVESGNITLKVVNGELIVNNLLSFRTYSNSASSANCPKGGPVATVEGNKLKIAFGQNIGTFNYPGFEPNQPVFFVGYVFDYEQQKFTALIQDGEVTFTINDDGTMTADKPYAMYIDGGIGWWTGVETSKFVVPNGTFTATSSGSEMTNDVYVEKQEKDGFPVLFLSSTFFGDGFGVWFDLDNEDPTYAAAIDQMVMDTDSEETYDYYLSSAEKDGDVVRQSKTVEGTISTTDGGQTLTYNNTWSVIALSKNESTLRWYGLIEPAVINFTLSGAGVEDNIIANDNSNAPVEYYNLQGIRINEPAAGSVVIRRQGTEVSKVLVK